MHIDREGESGSRRWAQMDADGGTEMGNLTGGNGGNRGLRLPRNTQNTRTGKFNRRARRKRRGKFFDRINGIYRRREGDVMRMA
jgi:hypothetical protein